MSFDQLGRAAQMWGLKSLFDVLVESERESWRTLPASTIELFKDGSFHVTWYYSQAEVDRDARLDAIGLPIECGVAI